MSTHRHKDPKTGKWITDVVTLPDPVVSDLTPLLDRISALENGRVTTAELATAVVGLDARLRALETPAPPPVPVPDPVPVPPPSTGALYGPAINADTKSNIQLHTKVAHRFISPVDGTIRSVRFQQRGDVPSKVYSGGTGGKHVVYVCEDANGAPGAVISPTVAYAPGNPNQAWDKFDLVSGITAGVSKGEPVYIVFENVDPDPTHNYFSVNEIYLFGNSPLYNGQRQPRFRDSEYAVLVWNGSSWQTQRETAVMDVAYMDGTHVGQAYVGMIGGISGLPGASVAYGVISGAQQVRETLSKPISASSGGVRVRHDHGSDPLVIGFGGTTVAVPANSIALSASGGDSGGAVWVPFDFGKVVASTGALTLLTGSNSMYTAAPIRKGTDVGMDASLCFPDGHFEVSADSGKTFKDPYFGGILDLQFFLR